MTRDEWELTLFCNVSDEVVQDKLNEYVLELESSNAKLRELVRDMFGSIRCYEVMLGSVRFFKERSDSYSVSSVYEQWMCLLGIEVDDGTK